MHVPYQQFKFPFLPNVLAFCKFCAFVQCYFAHELTVSTIAQPMMMLHKRITPLLQSVTDCVVKKHAHYLRFQSDKQIFTLASFERQLMTVRKLVSKQNIFRRQPANPFCSFTQPTAPNISPVLTNPNKKLLITTALT